MKKFYIMKDSETVGSSEKWILILFGILYLIMNYFVPDILIVKTGSLQSIYDVIFNVFDYTRNGIFYVPIFLYLGYWIGNSSFKKSYKYYFIWFVVCLVFMLIEG